MRSTNTYRSLLWTALFATVVLCARVSFAQDCSRNMLRISAGNSYVATPGIHALNLTNGFTIECWARVQTLSDKAALVDKGTYGILFQIDSTVFGNVQHTTYYTVVSTKNDSLGNWHHYALAFTPGDSLRLYIDTVEVRSIKAPPVPLDSNSDSLRIGMSMSGTGFIGSIDELRIWNAPQSFGTIKQHLYHVVPGNASGLVLYYSFDDASGATRIHDFSGHGRDGFVQGINASIVPSSSPMVDQTPGFALAPVEQQIVIPTLRCNRAFDTMVHVRNVGTAPILVDTEGLRLGTAFSLIPVDSNFSLPADSNIIGALRVHFEPPFGGSFSDSLYIASSSICGGRMLVALRGSYDSVGLRVFPDTLAFGTFVPCKLPTSTHLTITNPSVTDSVIVLSVTAPPGVQLVQSFPIALAPRQSIPLTVQLLPGPGGALYASLVFNLNKCNASVVVPMTADRGKDALSMQPMDMGTVPASLAGISRDTTIVVTNSGDVNDAITSISAEPDSILTIIDGRTGIFKAPGDTLLVHVRIHTFSCGTVTANLSLTTFQCQVDTSVSVSINVVPPIPIVAPNVNIGMVCGAQDTDLVLSNPNETLVMLDSISFSTNNVWRTQEVFPITIPAHDSVQVALTFTPSTNGNFIVTAYFEMSPCGTGVTVLSGDKGFSGVVFTEPHLLLGRGCKLDTVLAIDTLTNTTNDTVTFFTNTYSGSSRFSIVPFSFPVVIPPHDAITVSVQYMPQMGALDTGTFTFFSPTGCTGPAFSLRGSREIPAAKWSKSLLTFDTVCPGNVSTKLVSLIANGIDSIDVLSASVSGTGFFLQNGLSSFYDTGTFAIEYAPASEQNDSGTLTVVIDSCGTSFSLPLKGSGGPRPQLELSDTVLVFDSLSVDSAETECLIATNPSCTPLHTSLDTS
ncbi:MAG TPA: LamG domain-containing protein, partial [Candidatus Kapabacteria bacterium]